jgi:hypothetical protein
MLSHLAVIRAGLRTRYSAPRAAPPARVVHAGCGQEPNRFPEGCLQFPTTNHPKRAEASASYNRTVTRSAAWRFLRMAEASGFRAKRLV